MTGISTVSRRRLPASLSSKPMGPIPCARWVKSFLAPSASAGCCTPRLRLGLGNTNQHRLIVARHRFDGGDDLLIGDLVGGAGEGGGAPIHEDGAVALGVAAQGADQLTALHVVEGTKIHGLTPFQLKKDTKHRNPDSAPAVF